MGKLFVFGGMGAIVNCAIAIKASSVSLEHLIAEILVQPFSVISHLTPAFLGFMLGTAVMIIWTFLRAFIVRFLLGYNGWFLTPKNPINKLWYALMLLLVGRKDLRSLNYQQFLPTLPAPSLDKTLKKYLDCVRPLLTEEEYKDTQKAVKNFKKQGGKKLQFYLKLRSWTTRNWIADWWVRFIYLRQRTPISFNSNYFACGNHHPKTNSQLDRAAMMMYTGVKGSMEYFAGKWKNMRAQNLVPFCMDGVKYTTCACRIPGKEEDTMSCTDPKDVDHLVVFRKGRMYEIKCKDSNGTLLPPMILKQQLQTIVDMDDEDEVCEDGYMASFTGLPRTKWAEIRERLIKDPVNKKSLETIQSCYTVYVLTDETPDEDDFTKLGQLLFHGNGHDRWFDKCISVIVFANGNVGSNVDHTALDATVCGQYWEYMLSNEHYDENGRIPDLSDEEKKKFGGAQYEPKQLKWNLNGFQEDIQESKKHLQGMIADSDLIIMQPSYGKRFPKQCRLSPDGWFQMALQLTYYRLHKKFVLTYESATTRLYYKGRTETIRPVSDQSKKWVKAMDDENYTNEERKKLLKDAIGVQEKRKFEAMRGMGIDRHLFGLYIVAQWLKMDPLPDLFTDKTFQLPFTLSTSQTPLSFVETYNKDNVSVCGGFGTVTENGYGVSYLINGEDKVSFVVHSRKCCIDTDSSKFAQTLYQTMDDMKALYDQ